VASARGTAIALVVGLFAIYTIFILFRDNIENRVYEMYPLMLDVVFFFLCSLHPTREGLWLSTVTYFYLLCFSSLLYDWRVVAESLSYATLFFLGIRPQPTYALWPTVLLSESSPLYSRCRGNRSRRVFRGR